MIISYPTSASGMIVLLKTPPKYRKLDYNKNKKAQKSHAYAPHFCRTWYNGSYTMMAKPMKTLELHYPVIQFIPPRAATSLQRPLPSVPMVSVAERFDCKSRCWEASRSQAATIFSLRRRRNLPVNHRTKLEEISVCHAGYTIF